MTSAHPPRERPAAGVSSADVLAIQRNLVVLLGEKRRFPGALSRIPAQTHILHPEIRATVERILDRLHQLCAIGVLTGFPDSGLKPLVDQHEWLVKGEPPTLEQASALADGLHSIWIRLAPPSGLEPYASDHPPSQATGNKEVENLRDWFEHDHGNLREQASLERAHAAIRSRYLGRVGRILWALVVFALVVALVVAEDKGGLLLAAAAGAIGGTVTGARTLRTPDIAQARGFQAWWWVQPAVGAAVGLFVYALLNSAVVTLPGTGGSAEAAARTSAITVYCFAAGFSEPFVLGLLGKITGTTDVPARANDAVVPKR